MSTAKIKPEISAPSDEPKTYVGIKGWLVFLVVVLGVGLIMNVIGFFDNISVLRDTASNAAFELYPSLKSVLYFEITVLGLAIAAAALGLWLIFKRKKLAKLVVVGLLTGVLVTGIIDSMWLSSILADNPAALESVNSDKDLARAFVSAMVWGPYMYLSKRVKQTLVRP